MLVETGLRLTQPNLEAANAPLMTPPRQLPQVITELMRPIRRPRFSVGAASTKRTVAVVKRPPAPHPVNTLPTIKVVEFCAKPVIKHPMVKAVVQAKKRLVGLKIVASRPIKGFVQDEAICIIHIFH